MANVNEAGFFGITQNSALVGFGIYRLTFHKVTTSKNALWEAYFFSKHETVVSSVNVDVLPVYHLSDSMLFEHELVLSPHQAAI